MPSMVKWAYSHTKVRADINIWLSENHVLTSEIWRYTCITKRTLGVSLL